MTLISYVKKIVEEKNNELYFFYQPVIDISNEKIYQLICFVYATNRPQFTWKTADKIIINDLKYKTIVDNLRGNRYICTLEIVKTPNEKDNEISCVIKNELGTIHSTFSLLFMGHYKPINILHGDLNIHDNFKKISFEHYFISYELPVVEFYHNKINKKQATWSSQHFLKRETSRCYLNCMTVKFTDKPKENYSFVSVVKNHSNKIIGTKYFLLIPKSDDPVIEKSFQTVSTKGNDFEIILQVEYTSKTYPYVKWYGKRGELIITRKNITILSRQCIEKNKYITVLKIRSSFGVDNNIYYCYVQNLSGFFSTSFTCNY